jgi:dTDP-4-dehydrorhamnose reductase
MQGGCSTKIAIIGAAGQLGADLARVFGNDAITFDLPELDITDSSSLQILKKYSPDVIVNTAAVRNTDACENEPELTFRVNALGARNVGFLAKELGALNIYISTDFIFDGSKTEPYLESDPAYPLSVYGVSKLSGELFTKAITPEHYILRVASLFGLASTPEKRVNFVETMLRIAEKQNQLRVIDDIIMSPTYTYHVATALQRMLALELTRGTYHVVNSGSCSWFEFTNEIFTLLGKDVSIEAIASSEFKTKAERPRFSVLSNEKLKKHGIEMPSWKEGLKEYLSKRGN